MSSDNHVGGVTTGHHSLGSSPAHHTAESQLVPLGVKYLHRTLLTLHHVHQVGVMLRVCGDGVKHNMSYSLQPVPGEFYKSLRKSATFSTCGIPHYI